MNLDMSKALTMVLGSVEKKYGKGSIMKLTDQAIVDPDDVTSSGSIGLDAALGIGGYKKGRIIEIFGNEAGGKTTLCLHAVADAQGQGKMCAYIDSEHSLDSMYMQTLGVDLSSLLVSQPNYGEQALDIADMLIKSGEVNLIIVDSVAALIPQKELEGEIGDYHVGAQARMMSQAMRKLAGIISQTDCTLIFTNQLRSKIGVTWGSNEVGSGGNALKYYASQRLDIRRIGSIKQGEKIIGNRTRVKVVKNKLAPPFRVAEFDIRFGIGIDKMAEILDLGVEDSVIEKSGAWYSYEGTRLGQGKENSVQFFKEYPEIMKKIKKEIIELRGLEYSPTNTDKNDKDSKESKS